MSPIRPLNYSNTENEQSMLYNAGNIIEDMRESGFPARSLFQHEIMPSVVTVSTSTHAQNQRTQTEDSVLPGILNRDLINALDKRQDEVSSAIKIEYRDIRNRQHHRSLLPFKIKHGKEKNVSLMNHKQLAYRAVPSLLRYLHIYG